MDMYECIMLKFIGKKLKKEICVPNKEYIKGTDDEV